VDLKGRKVVVLGLGDTGLSMTRWLARHGADVRVADSRAEPPHAARLASELPRVALATGAFSEATLPQRQGWEAIASGRDTLIVAPTGSGKTLAAFLWALDHLHRLGLERRLEDRVYVVYVSPLRALNNDVEKNLRAPLAGIRAAAAADGLAPPEVRVAVRTGDTLAAARHVTLPLMRRVLLIALLFRTLDALRAFDLMFVLTGGGPANTTETLTVYAYRSLFQTLQLGFGSAVSASSASTARSKTSGRCFTRRPPGGAAR
jgi:hypothetical protein